MSVCGCYDGGRKPFGERRKMEGMGEGGREIGMPLKPNRGGPVEESVEIITGTHPCYKPGWIH